MCDLFSVYFSFEVHNRNFKLPKKELSPVKALFGQPLTSTHTFENANFIMRSRPYIHGSEYVKYRICELQIMDARLKRSNSLYFFQGFFLQLLKNVYMTPNVP